MRDFAVMGKYFHKETSWIYLINVRISLLLMRLNKKVTTRIFARYRQTKDQSFRWKDGRSLWQAPTIISA